MRTVDLVVWVLFIGALIFLGYFFTKRVKDNKKIRQQMQMEYLERKEKYTYLRPGIFDTCPREDVSAAAIFHCIRKEDEDFDHYFEKMIDGRLWLNPGSCGRSRFGGEVTMALMEIDNGNWNVRKINFSA